MDGFGGPPSGDMTGSVGTVTGDVGDACIVGSELAPAVGAEEAAGEAWGAGVHAAKTAAAARASVAMIGVIDFPVFMCTVSGRHTARRSSGGPCVTDQCQLRPSDRTQLSAASSG
jgi:hypothetical protein